MPHAPFPKPNQTPGSESRRSSQTASVSHYVNRQLADVATLPMFPDVDSLPSTQQQSPLGNGNLFRGLSQGSADMGRHVVRALSVVDIAPAVLWYELGKEVFQIPQHVRVSVFLNEQARRSVAQKQGAKTGSDARFRDDGFNFRGDFAQRLAGSLNFEQLLVVGHGQVAV
jgi:hypothetical protein